MENGARLGGQARADREVAVILIKGAPSRIGNHDGLPGFSAPAFPAAGPEAALSHHAFLQGMIAEYPEQQKSDQPEQSSTEEHQFAEKQQPIGVARPGDQAVLSEDLV